MKEQLLYKDLAKYYDLIYDDKDYKHEAQEVLQLIRKYKKSKGNKLLEVACGSGKHLQYLKNEFECMGLDLNKDILNIAKKNHPNLKFEEGNMTNFNLHQKFDVITCLFSSIGYVRTYDNLIKTINNFQKHLQPGGILIINPWLTPKKYHPGNPHMTTYKSPDLNIARLHVSKIKGNLSILEFNYLIAEKNKEVKSFKDKHILGLFETQRFLKIMRKEGFQSFYQTKSKIPGHRGFYVGILNH